MKCNEKEKGMKETEEQERNTEKEEKLSRDLNLNGVRIEKRKVAT